MKLTFYGGACEIGGNKILLEDKGVKVYIDFGQCFHFGEDFFYEYLEPRSANGLEVYFEFGLIPKVSKIEENSIPGTQGRNNSSSPNYHGPCPPSGTHRYFFKIYALDAELNLKEGLNKKELEKAMEGHILDKAELIGLYKKVR